MLVHTSTGLSVSPRLEWPDDSLRANEFFVMAVVCAREFSADYNDQQDLASEALLTVLRYKDNIQYPMQFLRRTIRNLCIDRSRSIGMRELTGYEWETSLGDLRADLLDQHCDPCEHLILRDTIERMESMLSPAEIRCYELMRQGYEQRDLPGLLRVSRQAVSRIVCSMRQKYLVVEGNLRGYGEPLWKGESKCLDTLPSSP
jgi:DNA-directed RNA polymerase specialized sigma24 family protein